MDKKKSNIKSAILQVGVVLFLIIGYFSIDFNSLYQSFKPEASFVNQDTNCDLHKTSCLITIQDGTSFDLEVTPKEIPLMKELTFTIKSNKNDLKDLTLNIYATNMFMGEFDLPIKNLGNNLYEAKGTLPTCPMGNMQWNAEIRVEKGLETVGARFQFKTDK
ncbi:hypothetical protein CRV08_10020 [Halarcobacter ebronensis]|uniref:YtkA-like domain-containing protein n=1 Tax=Halarcobacter ebronensis TaxID=1462615 RepID=A0A4Q0YBH7_9BACT|nr:hypothetical protein [Halarcobacter ebronensis]RXJ67697.1 hypothetical protein CRV08_10020 [Halarcobacter ebronensis]